EKVRLSVRARNCCRHGEIATLGQLAALRSVDVLSWQSAGIITLTELRAILAQVGLAFRDDPAPTDSFDRAALADLLLPVPEPISSKIVIYFADASEDQQRALITPVRMLPLSVRARNTLIRLSANLLGDVIQFSKSDFQNLAGTGTKSINE